MNTIRFVVGTRDDLRSSVWRLWANKNDLYLAARSHAMISKFSFHRSGKYRFAVNSTVEREDDASDRALYKWTRPDEFAPGWTRCFGILVPPRVTEMPFGNTFDEGKSIECVSPPADGKKTIFNIILSHKAATPEHVVSGSAHQVKILGRIEMPQEIAWLVTFEDDFTVAEAAVVQDHFDKLKIHLKPGNTGDGMNHTFLHAIKQGVIPFLIDIELGKENLDIPEN
ncbi:hypothetical protein EPO14_03905 [Patescibacteria group bacterium]|nr:MAG: hypothetical protein EPO14_03905 [Patescibacteria group bacterium]